MSEVDIRLLLLEQYEHALTRAWQKHDVDAALGAAQALLKVRKEALGAEHPEVANAMYEVAEALRLKRDLPGAAQLLREAVAIEASAYGDTHERYGEALHRLGDVLLAQRDADASPVLAQARSVLEHALGERDVRVAMALTAEAAGLQLSGELDRAAALLERALQVMTLTSGPESEAMAQPLEALASVQQARGLWDDALLLRQRVTRILQRVHSQALPHSLRQLAQVALDAGQLDVAEQAALDAVRLSEATARAHALEALAEVLERRGRFVEAREQYRSALDIYTQCLAPHHPQIGVASMNVATLEVRLGEIERAVALAEHSLRIFIDSFGPTHPHTRAMLEALQRTFATAGHADAWSSLDPKLTH